MEKRAVNCMENGLKTMAKRVDIANRVELRRGDISFASHFVYD